MVLSVPVMGGELVVVCSGKEEIGVVETCR